MQTPASREFIEVVDYDAEWPKTFARIRDNVWRAIGDAARAIEHVGSTSVPGLAAKPTIDIDIVVDWLRDLPAIAERLGRLGYTHRGNLGIEDREAFSAPAGERAHHLYVCSCDSIALRNHLAVRDYLRAHPSAAAEYAALKKQLATKFPHDSAGYVWGKTDFLISILGQCGFSADHLDAISRANRK
jgi:GrpB-like predicted nucleotidyltransferase (UPF0157 family)